MFCGSARDNTTIVGSPSCIHVGKYVLAIPLTSRRRRAVRDLATSLEVTENIDSSSNEMDAQIRCAETRLGSR